jgi:hypothetical protein
MALPRKWAWVAIGTGSVGAGVLLAALLIPREGTNREVADPGQPAVARQEPATAGDPAPPNAPPVPLNPATLSIGPLPPGTRVLLDGNLIGVAGTDGIVSASDVSPGRHVLQFTTPEYEPLTVTRDFAAGETVVLSDTDLTLKRAPVTIEFLADTTTQVIISQNGRQLRRFTGPAKMALAEGTYDVVAQGPAGIPTPRTLSVSAGGPRTIDVRDVVTAMELFWPGSWMLRDSWYTRRGGGTILYPRRTPTSDITFTVRRNRGGLFSSEPRLKWVVGYVDPRNLVQIELDDENLRLIEVTNGRRNQTEIRHSIPNSDQLHLNVQVSGTRLVQYYNLPGGTAWQLLNDWSRSTPIDGRFGFVLSGDEELQVTNFRYAPTIAR